MFKFGSSGTLFHCFKELWQWALCYWLYFWWRRRLCRLWTSFRFGFYCINYKKKKNNYFLLYIADKFWENELTSGANFKAVIAKRRHASHVTPNPAGKSIFFQIIFTIMATIIVYLISFRSMDLVAQNRKYCKNEPNWSTFDTSHFFLSLPFFFSPLPFSTISCYSQFIICCS